jgi:hypothetical protein
MKIQNRHMCDITIAAAYSENRGVFAAGRVPKLPQGLGSQSGGCASLCDGKLLATSSSVRVRAVLDAEAQAQHFLSRASGCEHRHELLFSSVKLAASEGSEGVLVG